MSTKRIRAGVAIAVACALLVSVGVGGAMAQEPNPLKNAYFGDLHVHTSWSPDAFTAGVRVTPDDAYIYAKGGEIDHTSGVKVKLLSGPLDFYAVTDHSEYMGVLPGMLDPNNPLSEHPLAVDILGDDPTAQQQALFQVVASITGEIPPIEEFADEDVSRTMWQEIQDIADEHYEPGDFTTFIAYEWTSNGPDGWQNLHRNIIFRDRDVPDLPYSSMASEKPEDLWNWMDAQRTEGATLLAIPHNSNLSDGLMFPLVDSYGKPIDRAYAEQRMRNEPIVEMTQIKGTSETHPLLSDTDEFAGFEISDFLLKMSDIGATGPAKGSYVRDAYKSGLVFEEATGANPYKFGMMGSSDTHNAGAPVEEFNYFGKIGREDGTPEARILEDDALAPLRRSWGASGLAAVWAEENTREAIYDALARKECFATSGPRMQVRLFGGWDYTFKDVNHPDFLSIGYDKGVTMGGDLPLTDALERGPAFLLWAVKDPNGANLDRIQIVKGWTYRGQTFEMVHDAAVSDGRVVNLNTGLMPEVGSTVNLAGASYDNSIGDAELRGIWRDEGFDPTVRSFYYARVLQIPTPRYTTYDAMRLGVAPPEPSTIQERAWSSPIWYTPSAEDEASGKEGAVTVASVEAEGGRALTTEELKDLLVGKLVTIRNNVTGQVTGSLFTLDGIRWRGEDAGFAAMHGGSDISGNPYEIKEGRLFTTFDDGSEFSAKVYKLGSRFLGAKSDEAGYVNYEITGMR
jgi:hypothetical protein